MIKKWKEKLLDTERLRMELEKEKKKSEEDEWVWKDIKAQMKNMKCRDFQYKLNKTYSMNGDDINTCNVGSIYVRFRFR